MSALTEEQIEQITKAVRKSTIESAGLKEDLIDHLCCVVEENMSTGQSFETAYQAALSRVCPSGPSEVQREAIFQLNSKSKKRLNNTLYVSGFIALTGILATAFMKLLHLPFAGLVLLVSICIAMFAFLPALFLRLYKNRSSSNRLSYILGFTGIFLLIIYVTGVLFHWPLSSFSVLLPAIGCCYIALFPLLFSKFFKKTH